MSSKADENDIMLNEITRKDLLIWWEAQAAILDKERNIVRSPNLVGNKLQIEFNDIINHCNAVGIPARIVTLKGRQQGSTTISCAALWHMMVQKSIKACIIGDEYEKTVKNIVDMFDHYAKTDAHEWGVWYHRPSGLFTNGSLLTTETANDNRAGASGTMQAILASEVAYWPENPTGKLSAKKVMAALLNCVPKKPGTLVVVESTPNGMGGVYYETYDGAITLADHKAGKIPRNWNGFFKLFYAWHEHPEYEEPVTEEDIEWVKSTLTVREWELQEDHPSTMTFGKLMWRRNKLADPAFLGDEDKFEAEYPGDEQRCFLLSGRKAFPVVPLRTMRAAAEINLPTFASLARQPNKRVARVLESEDAAWIKIWENPSPGKRFWITVDNATGASATKGADPDNHGVQIWRAGHFDNGWHPPLMAARVADCYAEKRQPKTRARAVCQWDTDVLIERLKLTSDFYGRCPIVMEVNMDKGMNDTLQRDGYPVYVRIEFNRREQKETPYIGWKTDAVSRPRMMEAISTALRKYGQDGDGIQIYDLPTISELETCVIGTKGRIEAMAGCHDDQVIPIGIALCTVESAQAYPFRGSGGTMQVVDSGPPSAYS
jgi:hypothetical protein